MYNSDTMFNRIELIAKETRHKVKKELMPDDIFFKTVLVHAYSPFINYGIKKLPWEGRGTKTFDHQTWGMLKALSERKLTGNKMKEVVKSEIYRLSYSSAELLKRILRKDMRCGISVMMINQRYGDIVPRNRVMRAESFNEKRIKFPCFIGVKIDGLRAIYRNGKFVTRKGISILGMDHIARELEINTILGPLDGELLVPNKKFDQTSGLIRNRDPIPDAQYWVFDIPVFGHFPFHIRYEYMVELLRNMKHTKVVYHTPVHNMEEINQFYKNCRSRGYEGAMVKSYYHNYQDRRCHDWMKLKPVESVDVKCIGIYGGKGKYKGQLGGIYIRFQGKQIPVGSGFSDKQRRIFSELPDIIVGRTVEVLFMERTPSGSFRHPRFVRIREDK